jgi:hypothetical protein
MLDPKTLSNDLEQYEKLTRSVGRKQRKTYIQYDFRAESGELFSTVKPTLDECRAARDLWLRDAGGPPIRAMPN